MASGRRDYTVGVLEDSISPGRYSVNYSRYKNLIIPAGESGYVDNYGIPEGYVFYMTSVRVSTLSPVINMVRLWKDSEYIIDFYFEVNCCIDFGYRGSYKVNAGESIVLVCRNYDDVGTNFDATILGVLEQIN